MQSIPRRLWFRGYSTNVGTDPDVSYLNMRDALMNINEGADIFPVGHVEVEVSLLYFRATRTSHEPSSPSVVSRRLGAFQTILHLSKHQNVKGHGCVVIPIGMAISYV